MAHKGSAGGAPWLGVPIIRWASTLLSPPPTPAMPVSSLRILCIALIVLGGIFASPSPADAQLRPIGGSHDHARQVVLYDAPAEPATSFLSFVGHSSRTDRTDLPAADSLGAHRPSIAAVTGRGLLGAIGGGLAGGLGGGVVGAALSNDESYLPGVTALGGLLIGEAAGMAYGIHRAHRRQGRTYRQRFYTTVGAGAVVGTAGVYVLSETEVKNGRAAAIVVAMPLLQLATAIVVERRSRR